MNVPQNFVFESSSVNVDVIFHRQMAAGENSVPVGTLVFKVFRVFITCSLVSYAWQTTTSPWPSYAKDQPSILQIRSDGIFSASQ